MSQYNNILQSVVSLASEQSTFIEILKATFDLGVELKPNAEQFSSDVDAVSQAISTMDEFPAQGDMATKLGFSLPSTISLKDASAFNVHTYGYVGKAQTQITADNAALTQEFDFRMSDIFTSHVSEGAHFSPMLSDTLLDTHYESTSKSAIGPQPMSAQIGYIAAPEYITVSVLESAKLEVKTAVLRHAKPATYFVVDDNYHQINQVEGAEDNPDTGVVSGDSSVVSQAEIDTLTKVLHEIDEQKDTSTQENTDSGASEETATPGMFTGMMPDFKQLFDTLAQVWSTDSDEIKRNASSATEETQDFLATGMSTVVDKETDMMVKDVSNTIESIDTIEPVDQVEAVQGQSDLPPIDPELLLPPVNLEDLDPSQLPPLPGLNDLPPPPSDLNVDAEQSQLMTDSPVQPVDIAVEREDVIATPVKENLTDTEEAVVDIILDDEPVKGQDEDTSVNLEALGASDLPLPTNVDSLPTPPSDLNVDAEQSQLMTDSPVQPVDIAVEREDVIAAPVKENSTDTEEAVLDVILDDEPVKGQDEDTSVNLETLGANDLPFPSNIDLLTVPLNLSDIEASNLPPMPDVKDLPPPPSFEQAQVIASPVDLSQVAKTDMPSVGSGQLPPPPENGFNLSSVKATDMPIASSPAPQTGGLLDGIMGMLNGGLKKAEPIAKTDVVQDSGNTGLMGMLSTAFSRFTITDKAQNGAEDEEASSSTGDSDWSNDTDWSEEDVSTIKPFEYRQAAKEICAKEKSQIESAAKHVQDHIDASHIQLALDALGEKFASAFSKQVEAMEDATVFNQQAGEAQSSVQEVLENTLSKVLPIAAAEVVEEQIYQSLQKAVSASNGTLSLSEAVDSYEVDYDAVNQDVGAVVSQALKAITDYAHGEFSHQQLTDNHASEVFEAVRTRFNFGKDMMLSKYPQMPEAGEPLKTGSQEAPDLSEIMGKRRGAIEGKHDTDNDWDEHDSVDLDALDTAAIPVDSYDSTGAVHSQADLLSDFNPHDMPVVDHFG